MSKKETKGRDAPVMTAADIAAASDEDLRARGKVLSGELAEIDKRKMRAPRDEAERKKLRVQIARDTNRKEELQGELNRIRAELDARSRRRHSEAEAAEAEQEAALARALGFVRLVDDGWTRFCERLAPRVVEAFPGTVREVDVFDLLRNMRPVSRLRRGWIGGIGGLQFRCHEPDENKKASWLKLRPVVVAFEAELLASS